MQRILSEHFSYRLDTKKKYKDIMSVEWKESEKKYCIALSSTEKEIKAAMNKSTGNIGLFITKLALLGNMDALAFVDYSICDVQIDRGRPYSKTMIYRKREEGERIGRELELDSTDVREFFSWAVQIFRVVYENKTVFADYMDLQIIWS